MSILLLLFSALVKFGRFEGVSGAVSVVVAVIGSVESGCSCLVAEDATGTPAFCKLVVDVFVDVLVLFAVDARTFLLATLVGLVARIVEKAGRRADSMRGNSTVCTISIPSRSSLAASNASSKSDPSNRLRTGSQFIRLVVVLLLASRADEKVWGDPGKEEENCPADIVGAIRSPLRNSKQFGVYLTIIISFY